MITFENPSIFTLSENPSIIIKTSGCKTIIKNDAIREDFQSLLLLDHENIVKFFKMDIYENKVRFFMEYLGSPTKDLFDIIIERHDEACKYYKQLLSAVEYLHTRDIAHMDIKPENCIIHNNKLKLIDFDFMILGGRRRKIKFRGTIPYASPQICLAQEFSPKKNDMWALGIILYIINTKTMPFTPGKKSLKHVVIANYYKPKKYKDKEIIERLISVDENNRPNIDELINNLSSPHKIS